LVKVKLIVVGKTKEDWIKEGIKHYRKLLKKYVDLEIIEVKEEQIKKSKETKNILDSEGEKVSKYLKNTGLFIGLDAEGKGYSSEGFADFFKENLNRGQNHFIFVLGGTWGLAEKILEVCPVKLSLSQMTFTHELSRIIILEQIYRAFSILAGGKYHK
jgi:23S rRNA (pseudouridine1915-N3)-methyltransferase